MQILWNTNVPRYLRTMSNFPEKFPSLPEKSPDSQKNFVFLPKRAWLGLSPPVNSYDRAWLDIRKTTDRLSNKHGFPAFQLILLFLSVFVKTWNPTFSVVPLFRVKIVKGLSIVLAWQKTHQLSTFSQSVSSVNYPLFFPAFASVAVVPQLTVF